MTPPETRYARSSDLRIAYQVVGTGPLDLAFVPGFVSNIDLFWEMPEWANFFSRLATFSRLILSINAAPASLTEKPAPRLSKNEWTMSEQSWTLPDRKVQHSLVFPKAVR
jgi:hypothetical protein